MALIKGRLRVLAACISLVAVSPAFALDLMESYVRARDSDPQYAMSVQSLEAIRERVPQARAGLLPVLSANGNYGYADSEVRFGRGADDGRNVESYGWNLQLTQPIFRLQSWASLNQASAQVVQAEAEVVGARQDLMLRVAQAYFSVLLARDEISAAEAQEAALQKQSDQAQASFKAGVSPITDVHEARSRLAIAQAQRHSANSMLESARADLEKLTGPIEGELKPIREGELLPQDRLGEMDAWIADASANHPKVIAKIAALRITEREVARSRAGHLPTLDLTASYGTSYTSGTTQVVLDTESSTRSAQVGLQLSMPILSGGSTAAKLREAEANLLKAKSDLELSRRDAAAEARKSYADYINGLRQVAALTAAVSSGSFSVQANTAGYRAGVRSSLDVLASEQVLHDSLRDRSKAKYEVLLSWIRLRASAGKLNESDAEDLVSRMKEEDLNPSGDEN